MDFVFDGPIDGPLFVFTHGAGASVDSDFINNITQGLAKEGIRVARFNFDYMQQRIVTGSRRPPERAPKLITQFAQRLVQFDQPLIIGGKSMGGRIASLLSAEMAMQDLCTDKIPLNNNIKAIACLGFPFHPVNKPESLRTAHFQHIPVPIFIAQGTRDKLGNQIEVANYALNKEIEWLWLEDGDHDLKPRVKSGFTHQAHLDKTIKEMALFIKNNI